MHKKSTTVTPSRADPGTTATPPQTVPAPIAEPTSVPALSPDSIESRIRTDLLAEYGRGQDTTVPAPQPVPEEPPAMDQEPSSEAPAVPQENSETPADTPTEPETPVTPPEDEEKPQDDRNGAQRRIDKLTAQKSELRELLESREAELAELKASLAERESLATSTAKANPVAHIKSPADLDAREAQAQELSEQLDDLYIKLRRNPEAVASELRRLNIQFKDAEGQDDYSRERMEEYLLTVRSNVDKTLRVHIPRHRSFLQVQSQAEQRAVELFPWWKSKTSAEYQMAQEILRSRPEIAQWADAKLAVGVYVEGFRSLEAKAKAQQAKPAPRPSAAPRVPSAPAAMPQRGDEKQIHLQASRQKLLDPKNPDGALEYIKLHIGKLDAVE